MQRTSPARDLAWITTLDVAAVLGSMALACMTPFVGLATAAALTLSKRAGLLTVLIAWSINQAVGYGLLGYPTDPATIGRGIGIGVCALAAFGVARFARSADGSIVATRAVLGFLAAFVAYEVVMYAFAMLLGGTENFTPAIVWMIGSNDALWFAGLMAVHFVLTTALPSLYGPAPRVRLV